MKQEKEEQGESSALMGKDHRSLQHHAENYLGTQIPNVMNNNIKFITPEVLKF